MIRGKNGRVYECIAIDLNTQRDFCEPDGACPVANLTQFIPALRRVIAWAKRNWTPVISSIDSHRSYELPDDVHLRHCVDGSKGQQKIAFTIFPLRANVEVDNTLSVPLDLFQRYQQVVFRKRTEDLLGNPKADRFLTQLAVEEFLIFGSDIEHSLKSLVLGLLTRNKNVAVVVDACGYWNKSTADLALRQVAAKGAHLITVNQLRTRRLSRLHRYRIARTESPSRGGNGHGHAGT